MSILYILVPISLLILALAIVAFFWAVKHQQFSDLESPAEKVIFDDLVQKAERNEPSE